MQVTPYLFFDGRCEEALNFYKKAIGAEVQMMMRFKEAPDQTNMPPNSGEKVMHACFKVGEKNLFASDGHCNAAPEFKGFALSLDAKDETDCDRLFNGLKDGGKVTMPLGETFFAKRFGMLTDKFGMNWMVIAAKN